MAYLCAFAPAAGAAMNEHLPPPVPGDSAPSVPNVRFTDLRGTPFKLADVQSRVRVLHYWATWCSPCVKELPHLDQLQGEYERFGLKIIPVSLDKNPDSVKEFYTKQNITHLESYLDPAMQGPRRLGLSGVPTSIFIDPQGRELTRADGPADWENPDIRRGVRALLGLK